jgi:uncharacterized membrane protein SpoIIM required for sporulation/uncharacterized RDD family membrane protein YckC
MESRPDLLQDRTMAVETPEHVSIEYPLAGLGSRFTALFADFLIMMVIVLVPVLAFLFTLVGVLSAGTVLTIIIVYFSLVLWGYFFFFEGFRDGQTPGKRALSIRVVMDGGYPITIEAAAIRNLIRIIDLQLGGLVGGLFMLFTGRAKRLGDLAASTVVVRELAVEFPGTAELAESAAPVRLGDAGFQALEKYVDRRLALDPAARARIAADFASHLESLEARREGEIADAYLVRFHSEERVRRLAAHRGGRAGSAAAVSLLRSKRERWEQFRGTARSARARGLASLGEEGVGDFAARYRELTADLARARTYGASLETLYALERLVGAGHNLFYRSAGQSLRRAWSWLRGGFPRLVRRRWAPIGLAAALLFGPSLISYLLLRARPEFERQLVGAEFIERAEEARDRREAGKGYIDVPELGQAFMASFIIRNNVQVSFVAFAAGVTAGVGTALVLIFNGLSLGSALAVFQNRQALDVIGMFVLPHGIIELTAITIAGGAGLWMGSGLLLPGRKTRLWAFAERAREAVSLLLGVICLLVLAGLIESFISPSQLPVSVKLSFSALAALAVLSYLLTGGRRASEGPDKVGSRL